MKTVRVQMVDAFVDGGEGGNPAGVVLDADALTTGEKQAIAANVGVSETAFVSASAVAGFKLEFFTPNRQIAHCGHATVGTFSLLVARGIVSGDTSKETIDGTRAIFIRDGLVYLEQTAPVYEPFTLLDAAALASQLGIDRASFDRHAPVVASTGNRFLLVPLRTRAAVASVRPDLDAIAATSDALDLIGYHVFARDTEVAGRDAAVRMFGPAYGIREEAATGAGAGPLGAWLHDVAGEQRDVFVIEQGRLMNPPSPSVLRVQLMLENGRIASVRVGGRGVCREERLITI